MMQMMKLKLQPLYIFNKQGKKGHMVD